MKSFGLTRATANMSHAFRAKPTRLAILKDRAAMCARARAFFAEREILEVDCPILSHYASVDAHIDLISANLAGEKLGYLHSSPEYPMKRLLSEGLGDIYQLNHVFRDGEHSPKHNPEFMMAEWYRVNGSFEALIDETIAFIQLFLGPVSSETLTYRQAFKNVTGLDSTQATPDTLISYLNDQGFPTRETEKDALLNLILGLFVEPHLGQETLTILRDYPATQAALAQTVQRPDETVALRFEFYYLGIELANGYLELTQAQEQRQRLVEANSARVRQGKPSLPIDEYFLKALETGLPPCAGVAVGFDRLMMLKHSCNDLSDVLPFGWNTV